MSKLQELLEQYCPDGVEQKRIADIASYEQPGKYLVSSIDYSDEFDTPVLTAGQTFVLGYTDEKTGIYPASKNDPVIIFDDFTGAFKWVDFPFKAKSSAMKMIKARGNVVLLRYLYHMMGFLNYTSDEHKRLWISVYSEFEVPVPPIEVQREIVWILDSFTELTTELTARQKQYEYYRDTLLGFDNADPDSWLGKLMAKYCPDGVERKPVKEVYTRLRGTSITAGKMKEIENPDGDIRVFAGGKTVINAFEEDIPNANITRVPAVLVQSRGIIDFVYYDKPFTFKNEMWAYTCDEQVSLRYLWHVLKNDISHFRKAAEGMGSLPQISLPVTEDYVIPVPPLDLQREIVKVLDRFSSLCSDVAEGLPAEIAARQKQYEYYRDRLLSF